MKRTMLGFGAAGPAVQPALSPPPVTATTKLSQSEAPNRAAQKALGSTMLGLAPGASSQKALPPSTPPPAPARPQYAGNRTMLGVAIPGIAPTRPGEGDRKDDVGQTAPPPPAPRQAPREARRELPRGMDAPLPPIVPAPAPLSDIPAPPRLRIVRKRGVPLVAVALAAGGLLVVGGAAIALLWHGAPPITALPRVTPDGTDVLHLTCDPASCADGTVAEIDGTPATFAGGAADLPLVQPLHVGTNPLSLHVDRPGMGRDEVVALHVPVAYRVWADVAPMSGPHPSILIHVQATVGSEVRVADKPVTLDGNGVGAYSIDETAATEGPADESRVVAMDIPYTVASDGKPPETGTVSARVSVAPLRVDAPGARAVFDVDHALLAGRAAKGATVTVDGAAAVVSLDGTFEKTVPLSAPGEISVEVRSGTTALAPRTVHVALKRVTSLVDEGKAFEKQTTVGYDAARANLATAAGQPIVVDGEVIEPRSSGHRTLLLVDDHRGCAKGPCLARVVVGQELSAARGDRLRAYGRVARGFTTPTGETLPEIEADFVVPVPVKR
jgi:hypothetical protein